MLCHRASALLQQREGLSRGGSDRRADHDCFPLEMVDRIIEKIWGYESDVEYNNIEVYISFLRKKLASISAPVQIKTARGIGYSLEQEG